ncbi:MAG: fructose-6-phosphate aldolase [Pseudomonadota bacterium]
MKFFIDTANITEIKAALSWGILDGVTTNPSLIAKEGKSFRAVVDEICRVVPGPVSLEVLAANTEGMVEEGRKLAAISKNAVVKLPMGLPALAATKALAKEGIHVNMTLVFSPTQAIMAAKAGAAYVSPFVGRLDDISHNGMELIAQLVRIFANYKFTTEILVASVRSPNHVIEAAMLGADIATIPFKVLEQFAKHPLTDIGIETFSKDWQKVPTS